MLVFSPDKDITYLFDTCDVIVSDVMGENKFIFCEKKHITTDKQI
jgi:hypothetical protein